MMFFRRFALRMTLNSCFSISERILSAAMSPWAEFGIEQKSRKFFAAETRRDIAASQILRNAYPDLFQSFTARQMSVSVIDVLKKINDPSSTRKTVFFDSRAWRLRGAVRKKTNGSKAVRSDRRATAGGESAVDIRGQFRPAFQTVKYVRRS